MWTVGRCIVYIRIRLLLLFHPFTFSFFFLSNFQTLLFFVTLFSGTVRSRRLKLSTHVDSRQMYRVYQNQAAAAYKVPLFFIFLSFQFSTLKIFVILFSGTQRLKRLKLYIHVDNGRMYRVYRNDVAVLIGPFYFFIFLSFQFLNIRIFRHTFLRNFETLKIETWCTHGQWTDVSCIPISGCCCIFSLYFFLFLSLKFSNIKLFHPTFLRNCEALKIETWYTCGQWADLSCIPESGCCCLYIPLFLHFSFSPIFKHYKFSSHFSQELWGLVDWNLVHMWTKGRCILYTGIRLLLLIHPFISSFFFLSIFVTLFSGAVRLRRLKLGTHVDRCIGCTGIKLLLHIRPFISSISFL